MGESLKRAFPAWVLTLMKPNLCLSIRAGAIGFRQGGAGSKYALFLS